MQILVVLIFVAVQQSFAIARYPFLIQDGGIFHDFPKNFSFGASTAAYQIEGGWNEDGKGKSIWDSLTHLHPELVADHQTADVGDDSYHFYKKDVEALKQVGVNKNSSCSQLKVDNKFSICLLLTVSALSLLGRLVKNLPKRDADQQEGVRLLQSIN